MSSLPGSGIEPTLPALAGRLSTPGPPEMSLPGAFAAALHCLTMFSCHGENEQAPGPLSEMLLVPQPDAFHQALDSRPGDWKRWWLTAHSFSSFRELPTAIWSGRTWRRLESSLHRPRWGPLSQWPTTQGFTAGVYAPELPRSRRKQTVSAEPTSQPCFFSALLCLLTPYTSPWQRILERSLYKNLIPGSASRARSSQHLAASESPSVLC